MATIMSHFITLIQTPMRSLLYLVVISCLGGTDAYAQLSMGLHLQYAGATRELNAEGYKDGVGLNLEFLHKEMGSRIPIVFQVGGRLDVNLSGAQAEDILLNSGESATIRLRNNHLGMLGIARALSPYAPFRMYADGLIGTRVFFSQDIFRVKGDEEADIENVANTFTFTFGGSLGCLIELNEELSLDVRATYTRGGWARYVDLESVEQVNNEVRYEFKRSETPLLMIQLGINLYITDL